MHIKTRLDLIMDALTVSRQALWYLVEDQAEFHKANLETAKKALEKIEKAFEAVNGTEERPGT